MKLEKLVVDIVEFEIGLDVVGQDGVTIVLGLGYQRELVDDCLADVLRVNGSQLFGCTGQLPTEK